MVDSPIGSRDRLRREVIRKSHTSEWSSPGKTDTYGFLGRVPYIIISAIPGRKNRSLFSSGYARFCFLFS